MDERKRADSLPDPSAGVNLPPAVLDGWYVLHQMFMLDWPALKALPAPRAAEALNEFGALARSWDEPAGGGWSGLYRMIGGGVDLMCLHFRESLDGLSEASHEVVLSDLGDHLLLAHENVSVVALGLYGVTLTVAARVDPGDTEAWTTALEAALAEEREKPYVQRRLRPRQPDDMPYVSYYPMDKTRGTDRNWYTLPLERRAELMRAHGSVGRRYAGRISQVISGSTGLSDWEWAVTLFAADPIHFKEIITEMRYDEASARYAEFGPFFVGKRLAADDLTSLLSEDRW